MPVYTRVDIDMTKIANKQIDFAKKQLIAIGMEMTRDIKIQMSAAGSGRIYGRHISSSPGGYPAVHYGRLRASISCNWSNSGIVRGAVDPGAAENDGVMCSITKPFTVTVGTNVYYAPFLEFGTSKMSARPFVRPTFEKYKSAINQIVRAVSIAQWGFGSPLVTGI